MSRHLISGEASRNPWEATSCPRLSQESSSAVVYVYEAQLSQSGFLQKERAPTFGRNLLPKVQSASHLRISPHCVESLVALRRSVARHVDRRICLRKSLVLRQDLFSNHVTLPKLGKQRRVLGVLRLSPYSPSPASTRATEHSP